MTCGDIIALLDQLKPNEYSDEEKLAWLTQIDRQIFTDIVLTHYNSVAQGEAPADPADGQLWWVDPDLYRWSDGEWVKVFPYHQTSDELLLGEDAGEMYRLYLMSQIDFYNADYERYNNTSALYNSVYSRLEKTYNRTKRAASRRFRL